MSGVRGVTRHNGRTFDWAPRHDPRSRGFAIRDLVGAQTMPTKAIYWTGGPCLDQKAEGACVGMGVTGEFLASPVRGKLAPGDRAALGSQLAFGVYNRAKEIDRYPGVDYDGTDVNAGMKVGRERGWWDSYHWAFGIDDIKRALLVGPVVLGIEWREGMYDARGRDAELVPDGRVVGGHCILVTGWSPKYSGLGETFRLRNSWGPDFGKNGNCYLRADNLRALLDADGEAAVPTGRHLGSGLLVAAAA